MQFQAELRRGFILVGVLDSILITRQQRKSINVRCFAIYMDKIYQQMQNSNRCKRKQLQH